jgi:hypothetical protein
MERPHDPAYNRDEESKPGRPPRMAQEPRGGKRATDSPKTATDPATGEARRTAPEPNRAGADARDPPRRT